MDSFRFLSLRFYIYILLGVLFSSKVVISSRLYIAMTFSGVPDTVKTNGEAAVPSSPVKPVAQTGVSSGDVN